MSFVRAACAAALAFASFACTSADFNTAPAGPGGDSGTPVDTAGTPDGGSDPCAASPGVARFCVSVAKVDAHPPYGKDLPGVDGQGGLKVYLYSEDPGDLTRKTPVKPFAVIPYPADGSKLDIDKDFPVTISSSAFAGHYWFTVVFEDSEGVTRPENYAAVPGDFIVVPPVSDNKLLFPEVTLVNGETKPIPVSLKPIRQVGATVQAAPLLVAFAKAHPEVHGDGMLAFLLYRGDLSGTGATPTLFDLVYTHCVDLALRGLADTIPISFGTILAEGDYRVLGVVFDYDYPTVTGGKSDFPGKGSIISRIADATIDKIPSISIKADKWVATVNVDMTDVPSPAGGIPEKQVCPGAK